MNSRGFTLIELIITIALLSMLFSLIATNMVGLQSRQLQANYNNYKAEIESAACLFMDSRDAAMDDIISTDANFNSYVNMGSVVDNKAECIRAEACYVRTKELLELGYLNKDLKDPSTGAPVTNDEVVRISYSFGEKTCLYFSN